MLDLVNSTNGQIEALSQRRYNHGNSASRHRGTIASNKSGVRSWCGVRGNDVAIREHPFDDSTTGFNEDLGWWEPPTDYPFCDQLAGGGVGKPVKGSSFVTV